MAEPALSPAAEIVRRYDPELFHAALFAAEPFRERLMVLYAFDVELSRAAARADRTEQGPIIAEMRLQFWRDVIEGAFAGAEPRAHEVAGPLATLIADAGLERAALEGMAEARSMELSPPFTRAAFDRWLALRFGGLTRLAAACLGAGGPTAEAGTAAGIAFTLRLAAPMAVQSRMVLMPGLGEAETAALMRGETTDGLRQAAKALAEEGLDALSSARARRREATGAAPAFLHLWRAEADLRAATRPGFDLATGFPDPSGARRAVTLLLRAATGRW